MISWKSNVVSHCRFVPDFTISRVSNTLRFTTTSGGELLFPLLAILPHNLLAVCYAMQPRPEWEQTIAWLSVPFWICVIVTMVAVVLVQTNFGLGNGVSYQTDRLLPMMQATGGQVFDLSDVSSRSTPSEPERPRESERVREAERAKEPVTTRKSRYAIFRRQLVIHNCITCCKLLYYSRLPLIDQPWDQSKCTD